MEVRDLWSKTEPTTGEGDEPQQTGLKRSRRWSSKTRLGCLTCKYVMDCSFKRHLKMRRVKCDEGKPACYRCIKYGTVCEGYSNFDDRSSRKPRQSISPIRLAAAQKLQDVSSRSKEGNGKNHDLKPSLVIPARNTTLKVFSQAPLAAPSLDITGSERERRSFQFFRLHAKAQMSGFFDTEFWTRYALQSCHYDPAIRHAAIALGALYEQFQFSSGIPIQSEKIDNFASQHYLQAISALLKAGRGEFQMKIALIVCVLFISFENIRGYYGAALQHIDAGLKILSELGDSKKKSGKYSHESHEKEGYVPNRILTQVFTGLNIRATHVMIFRSHHSSSTGDLEHPVTIPSSFTTVQSAKDSLIQLIPSVWRVICSLWLRSGFDTSTDDEERETCLRQIENVRLRSRQWSVVFNEFYQQPLGGASLKAAQLLRLYQIMSSVVLDMEPQQAIVLGETRWDKYTAKFAAAVECASALVYSLGASKSRSGRTYNSGCGFVSPIFCAIQWCRDPVIRRRGVWILEAASCRDGCWDSELLAKIGKRIIAMEEKGLGKVTCAADVPNWARVAALEPRFDVDNRSVMVEYWKRSVEGEAVSCKEYFEW